MQSHRKRVTAQSQPLPRRTASRHSSYKVRLRRSPVTPDGGEKQGEPKPRLSTTLPQTFPRPLHVLLRDALRSGAVCERGETSASGSCSARLRPAKPAPPSQYRRVTLNRKEAAETHSSEEPPVLAREVALLKELLDLLLRVLAGRDLLERLGRDDALEALELERVAGREEVVVVDRLWSERGSGGRREERRKREQGKLSARRPKTSLPQHPCRRSSVEQHLPCRGHPHNCVPPARRRRSSPPLRHASHELPPRLPDCTLREMLLGPTPARPRLALILLGNGKFTLMKGLTFDLCSHSKQHYQFSSRELREASGKRTFSIRFLPIDLVTLRG